MRLARAPTETGLVAPSLLEDAMLIHAAFDVYAQQRTRSVISYLDGPTRWLAVAVRVYEPQSRASTLRCSLSVIVFLWMALCGIECREAQRDLELGATHLTGEAESFLDLVQAVPNGAPIHFQSSRGHLHVVT